MTPKQRMLNAYRGVPNDRPPVAPEFWYYYPAKVLGVDMIEFEREVPFHLALKEAFEKHSCEGWGAIFAGIPNDKIQSESQERWADDDTLEVRNTIHTPSGSLTRASRYHRLQPSWSIEKPIKDIKNDLPAWEIMALGGHIDDMEVTPMIRAWEAIGESYLIEAWLGVPFFDFFAGSLEGGFPQGIYAFMDPELQPYLRRLQERYTERLVSLAKTICEKTPLESLCIGCSWSCNSLLGPDLWRRWDKPGIDAVCREIHRHGKLLHIHFHGRCIDTVADFSEIGIDCVCPFERPPGGDVSGVEGLKRVEQALRGVTTMNGNVHTVETLIRGKPDDVRQEVAEIAGVFKGNPRLIIGTGDQVGGETPEENIEAMIDEVKRRTA